MALADLEKPIPVKFDYATFRYYLQLDVLQDTAKFLDWTDINKEYGGTSRTVTVTGTILADTNIIEFDEPSPVGLLSGSEFSDGVDTYTTVGIVPVGGANATIDYDDVPSVTTQVSITVTQSNLTYRNAQPIYDAITDEVILRMGYTHPLQVPTEKIREMMLLGRVEAWRKVVHNTVTDVDINYELLGGQVLVLTRSQMHIDSIKQWVIAQEDYNAEFPLSANNLNYSTPDVRTYAGKVVGRW